MTGDQVQSKEEANKLTDQEIRDQAEVGHVEDAMIWEHTLVEVKETGVDADGKATQAPDFKPLEECQQGKEYWWHSDFYCSTKRSYRGGDSTS